MSMMNQTVIFKEMVKNGETGMASNFYPVLNAIPNLQMYIDGEDFVWTAWDMESNYEYAYSLLRMLTDIAIEHYDRGGE